MFILFDTNVWLSEFVLNSPSGAAVRFFIRRNKATVAVPEVVRLEVERNLRRLLVEMLDSIRNNHRKLLAYFGSLPEMALPNETEINDSLSNVFGRIDVPLRELPFSLEVARSSFLKTIEKSPPCDKTQEFKDGVIWAHCIDLLSEADVYLVTSDKAFFQERNYGKGLASELKDESAQFEYDVKLFPDLKILLEDIREEIPISKDKLEMYYLARGSSGALSIVNNEGFLFDKPRVEEIKIYATEMPTRLYVAFELESQCPDVTGQKRSTATLNIIGDCAYNTEAGEFSDLRNQEVELRYSDEEGQSQRKRSVFASASTVPFVGSRSVRHTVKEAL